MVTARKTAGLTQVQMAERLAVGQSYVSKIERGESYVDVMTFVDWYLACGLRPGVVLDALYPSPELSESSVQEPIFE